MNLEHLKDCMNFLITWSFCEKCGSDEDINYCSTHRLFLCISCDYEMHSPEIYRGYVAYQ